MVRRTNRRSDRLLVLPVALQRLTGIRGPTAEAAAETAVAAADYLPRLRMEI